MNKSRKTYAAIIVLYNKKIRDSITCECIKKMPNLDIEIIVVDNSEEEQGNLAFCQMLGYKYISMQGNKGLSKAYNVAINQTEANVLILFDDDTEVTNEYFRTLENAVNENPTVDIFAPVVYGQDGVIYSPNEFNFLRNKFIKSAEQDVAQENFNAIASCLAIRKRVFNNYRFDEVLFVDQVDQYFFCEQRALGKTFMKLDTIINQNFYQRSATLSAEAGWRRVRLRIIDVMRHANLMGGIKFKLLGFVKCCGLSVQIAIKSKSPIVLFKGGLLSLKQLISSL